jgi:1-acyl-sn-glycerol-3-phosphate acyltransferase
MMAKMDNTSSMRFIAFVVNNMLVKMYHQGIHIREDELSSLKSIAESAAAKKIPIIFLPCHKSHIDYLVMSYIFYRLGISLPHIVAGDNLNIPFVGGLLRRAGAFFIRRQWGDDPLYHTVMQEYIITLLQHGYNIEAFVEGTRSRIGKLLQPKFGFLKIILSAFFSKRIEDAIIVPISIDYDRVIETASYVDELLGKPKEQESLLMMLSNINILGVSRTFKITHSSNGEESISASELHSICRIL